MHGLAHKTFKAGAKECTFHCNAFRDIDYIIYSEIFSQHTHLVRNCLVVTKSSASSQQTTALIHLDFVWTVGGCLSLLRQCLIRVHCSCPLWAGDISDGCVVAV